MTWGDVGKYMILMFWAWMLLGTLVGTAVRAWGKATYEDGAE